MGSNCWRNWLARDCLIGGRAGVRESVSVAWFPGWCFWGAFSWRVIGWCVFLVRGLGRFLSGVVVSVFWSFRTWRAGALLGWIVRVVERGVFPARLSWCVAGEIGRVIGARGVFLVAGMGAGSLGRGARGSGVFGRAVSAGVFLCARV